jgi:hypothetical protein
MHWYCVLWPLFMAAVLGAAGLLKAHNPFATARVVDSYLAAMGLSSLQVGKPFTYVLGAAELVMATVLVDGRWPRTTLLGATALLSLFTLWAIHASTIGAFSAGCGCGLPAWVRGSALHSLVVQNLILLTGCIVVLSSNLSRPAHCRAALRFQGVTS